MIRDITPPRLDQARIDQMISTTLTVKQEARKSILSDILDYFATPLHAGVGASLVAASIAGMIYLSPAVQPVHSPVKASLDSEVSDIMLYDFLDNLS
jgi:hypothetical protein